MLRCEECNLDFKNASAKANHVRWNHKDKPFTDKGLANLKAAVTARNRLRGGSFKGELILETITCPKCPILFERKVFEFRKDKGRKFCSKCSNKRNFSFETRQKMSKSASEANRRRILDNPFILQNGVSHLKVK